MEEETIKAVRQSKGKASGTAAASDRLVDKIVVGVFQVKLIAGFMYVLHYRNFPVCSPGFEINKALKNPSR